MKDNTDRTLILVGLVCLMLLLMHFLPPITVGGVTLRTVSVLSDLSPQPQDTAAVRPLQPQPPAPAVAEGDTATAKPEQWPKDTEPIADYSGGQPGGMAHFYAMLDSLQRGRLTARPLRIAYFADSYTEGDILTADLREQLQSLFGGQGVGWIDAANDVNEYRISLSVTDQGMTGHMAMQKEGYDASRAGIAARYAPFSGRATMQYDKGTRGAHAAQWQVARLYLRTPRSVAVTARMGSAALTKSVSGKGVREAVLFTPKAVSATTLTLAGAGTVFGTSLEGPTGIVLDNFSMRSASGLHLAQVPDQTLREFQALRHYDLVILSYGGNVVSPDGKADDCAWYVKKMQKVVAKMKACFPTASILLFGSPDFGTRRDGRIVTPESIKGLITCQNQMAADCRVAFYDLLSAMGGDGTAGRMNSQKMVGDDLFHITPKGGEYAARRICRSIVAGLKIYQGKKKH